MTEVKIFIYDNEIAMLKDFMEKRCSIDDINLQWTDELYSLLRSLGHIVTAPGFDEIVQEEYAEAVKNATVPKS